MFGDISICKLFVVFMVSATLFIEAHLAASSARPRCKSKISVNYINSFINANNIFMCLPVVLVTNTYRACKDR